MVTDVSDIDVLVGAEVKSKLESETNVEAAIQNVVDVAEGGCEFKSLLFPTLSFVLKSTPVRTYFCLHCWGDTNAKNYIYLQYCSPL